VRRPAAMISGNFSFMAAHGILSPGMKLRLPQVD